MKKYIKIDAQSNIVDVFYDHQKNKFDGTEIFLQDEQKPTYKLNGKSISNEIGVFIFKWELNKVIEKKKAEIDADPLTIAHNKKEQEKILQLANTDVVKILDDLIQNIAKTIPLPANIITESTNRVNLRSTIK